MIVIDCAWATKPALNRTRSSCWHIAHLTLIQPSFISTKNHLLVNASDMAGFSSRNRLWFTGIVLLTAEVKCTQSAVTLRASVALHGAMLSQGCGAGWRALDTERQVLRILIRIFQGGHRCENRGELRGCRSYLSSCGCIPSYARWVERRIFVAFKVLSSVSTVTDTWYFLPWPVKFREI